MPAKQGARADAAPTERRRTGAGTPGAADAKPARARRPTSTGTGATRPERPEQTRGTNARVLGPRALATRRRLLDATAELLGKGTILDFKVIEVARAVGTSPATFYQYFPTVDDALLTLSAEVNTRMGHLYDLLWRPWDTPESVEHARGFTDGYMRHWDENRAVLRARGLAAQEGDERFRRSRNEAIVPMTTALEAKVIQAQAAGRVSKELQPFATGAALVAMVERMAAFREEFLVRGVNREHLVDTTARVIHQTVTGFVGGR